MLAASSSAMAQNLNSAYFTDQFASRNTMTRHSATTRTSFPFQVSAT